MVMSEKQKNWAGNLTYHTTGLQMPETVAHVQALVQHNEKVKGLGTRHSFNHIADGDGIHLSLQKLNRVVSLDGDQRTVTVEGGIRYGELGAYLYNGGFALHNLASLPHISVAGACATATHGSGVKNSNLATAVSAIKLITANGDAITLTRDDEAFYGAIVGLGALGIISKLTLEIEPTYTVRQDLFENLPFVELEANFDTIMSAAYSVSLFTDWHDDFINQIWLKSRLTEQASHWSESEFFGATRADDHRHPLSGHSAENCTLQMGIVGPWHERLPHFKMDFTPSSGEELQSEYFVAREDALAALSAINEIRDLIAPHLLISEIRTIAADNLWMSPCYHQDCVAIHFTWQQNWPSVQKVLPVIEEKLAPFNGRPHWGKLFTMSPAQLQPLYPQRSRFVELYRIYDPQRKFSNAFLDAFVLGDA